MRLRKGEKQQRFYVHALDLQAPGADQDENEDFLSFGNEPAEADNAPAQGAASAEDGQPSTSGRVETPWKAGSYRICSPLIRLHNGELQSKE